MAQWLETVLATASAGLLMGGLVLWLGVLTAAGS